MCTTIPVLGFSQGNDEAGFCLFMFGINRERRQGESKISLCSPVVWRAPQTFWEL